MKYLVKIGKRSYMTSDVQCARKLAKRNNGNIKMLNGEQDDAAEVMMARNRNRA